MSELKETKKMKVVQLFKNSPLGSQKVKNDSKIESNVRIEGPIGNKSTSTT